MFPYCVNNFIEKYEDPRTNEYLLSSIWSTLSIVFFYLLFTFKIGPWYMKDKEPFNVRKYVIIYNAGQILTNGYLFIQAVRSFGNDDGMWFCRNVDYSNSEAGKNAVYLSYLYFLLKILDVLDTVFFILRKSYRQVSYVHVYHHATMIFLTWVTFKFIAGGFGYWIGILNTFVHVVMYSYYLISSIISNPKSILTFKKSVTTLQLMQFAIFAIITIGSLFEECKFSVTIRLIYLAQALYFVYLFGSFYYNEYIIKPKVKEN